MDSRPQAFTTTVIQNRKGRVLVPLPFEPEDVWGSKREHPVDGMGVRAVVEPIDDGWGIVLGPAWRRDCGVAPGDRVDIVLVQRNEQHGSTKSCGS